MSEATPVCRQVEMRVAFSFPAVDVPPMGISLMTPASCVYSDDTFSIVSLLSRHKRQANNRESAYSN